MLEQDKVLGKSIKGYHFCVLMMLSTLKKNHCMSFHLFCKAKFDILRNELNWLEDWPDDLVKILLEASKHVWRAQHLALAFNPVASSFLVKASQKFDARLMEPLEIPPFVQANSLLPSTNQSRFVVFPGYFVLDRIVKCQVCLASDNDPDSS